MSAKNTEKKTIDNTEKETKVATEKTTKKSESKFKLPKYLKLAKGSMWFDIEGENASGVRLYTSSTVFVGRGLKEGEENIPRDKYGNQNLDDFGYIEKELPWYVDTTTVPPEKLSRIIVAYNAGILDKADPEKKPVAMKNTEQRKDFDYNKLGDRIFVGKNKEMYKKLQTLNFEDLRSFIYTCPRTELGKNNLIDLYDYETLGYNKMMRPRQEVLDLIKAKLKEFGPSMSGIRINEED